MTDSIRRWPVKVDFAKGLIFRYQKRMNFGPHIESPKNSGGNYQDGRKTKISLNTRESTSSRFRISRVPSTNQEMSDKSVHSN